MRDSKNPIVMILLGAGFLVMAAASLIVTIFAALAPSGIIGKLITVLAIGGIVTFFYNYVAAGIVGFAGLILQLASAVFEMLLNYTVIGFGDTLSSFGILNGIKVVWTAFRDIANIIIVGMFVFVAIATILNNTNYGVKKFLVRILIVAVLINFSLLFTQLVIDLSHVAATTFYQGIRAAASNGAPVEVKSESAFETFWKQQGGIAGAFQKKMGIATINDNAALLKRSDWVPILLYVVVAPILLLTTAGVFLYGGYLLLARALVLIVLLTTSALAFASWLIPGYDKGKYSWSGWWEALIRSAVFAPLLMMFLWATLKVLEATQTGSLGKALTDPSDARVTAQTIIVYLFTIGMLYLSINIANSFSKNITGFDYAKTGLGLAGSWLASSVGMLGRGTLGVGAKWAQRQSGFGQRMALENAGLRERPSSAVARLVDRFSYKALQNISKASFNAGRIPDALKDKQDAFNKRYGIKEAGKGGAIAAEKRASDFADKAREEARKELGEVIKKATPPAPSAEDRNRMYQEAARNPQVDPDTRRALQDQVRIQRDAQQRQNAFQGQIQRIERDLASTSDQARRTNLLNERTRAETALRATAQTIEKAQQRATRLQEKIYDSANKRVTSEMREQADRVIETTLAGDDDRVRAELRGFRNKQRDDADLNKLIKGLKDKADEGAPAPQPTPRPTPPAAPPSAPPAGGGHP